MRLLTTRRRSLAAIGGAVAASALLSSFQHEGVVTASMPRLALAAGCGAIGALALTTLTHRASVPTDRAVTSIARREFLLAGGLLVAGTMPLPAAALDAQAPPCSVVIEDARSGRSALLGTETMRTSGDEPLTITITATEPLANRSVSLEGTGFGPRGRLLPDIRLGPTVDTAATVAVDGFDQLRGRHDITVSVSSICQVSGTLIVDKHVWQTVRGLGSLLALAAGLTLVATSARPAEIHRWQSRTHLIRFRLVDPETLVPVTSWPIGDTVMLEVGLDPSVISSGDTASGPDPCWFDTMDLHVTVDGWGVEVHDRLVALDPRGSARIGLETTGGPTRLVVDLHADGHLLQTLRLDPSIEHGRVGRLDVTTTFDAPIPQTGPSEQADASAPVDQSITLHAGPDGHPLVIESRELRRTDARVSVISSFLSEADVAALNRSRRSILAICAQYFGEHAFPTLDGSEAAVGRLIEAGRTVRAALTGSTHAVVDDGEPRHIAVNEEWDTLARFTMPWAVLHDGDPHRGIDGCWGFAHDLGAPLGWLGDPRPRSLPAPGPVFVVDDNPDAPHLEHLDHLEIERVLVDDVAGTGDTAPSVVYAATDVSSSVDDLDRFGLDDPSGVTTGHLPLDPDGWRSNPVVVLNGFRCGAQAPTFARTSLPRFHRAGASAVIATEIDTSGDIAELMGSRLVDAIGDGARTGAALRDARMALWSSHANPIGLIYRLHGRADQHRTITRRVRTTDGVGS